MALPASPARRCRRDCHHGGPLVGCGASSAPACAGASIASQSRWQGRPPWAYGEIPGLQQPGDACGRPACPLPGQLRAGRPLVGACSVVSVDGRVVPGPSGCLPVPGAPWSEAAWCRWVLPRRNRENREGAAHLTLFALMCQTFYTFHRSCHFALLPMPRVIHLTMLNYRSCLFIHLVSYHTVATVTVSSLPVLHLCQHYTCRQHYPWLLLTPRGRHVRSSPHVSRGGRPRAKLPLIGPGQPTTALSLTRLSRLQW